MSERLEILRKPMWATLATRPGVGDLPLSALKAADSFLEFQAAHRITAPELPHISRWAESQCDAFDALASLSEAMTVVAPALGPQVHAAQGDLEARASQASEASLPQAASRQCPAALKGQPMDRSRAWDPIAPPSRRAPVARQVSVEPHELPAEWQSALRRMAQGFPHNGAAAPAESIVKRIREKLCQMCWSARRAGFPFELSEPVLLRFENDVRTRSAARKHGLRWATVRASIEEVDRFARYSGADADFLALCRFRLQRLTSFEKGQRALKFFELVRTGHTTLGLLDLADDTLAAAGLARFARQRHLMRNRGAILGIYTVAPLRNASADLVFGRTLFWEGSEWVIDTQIQKTQRRNPEAFVYPLEPQHGRYIDAVILGDHEPSMLPRLRDSVLQMQRPLFIHHDGSPTGAKEPLPPESLRAYSNVCVKASVPIATGEWYCEPARFPTAVNPGARLANAPA